MTVETKFPLPGKVVDTKEDVLEDEQKRVAKRILKVMEDLDKIREPLMVTIMIGADPVNYRNEVFWLKVKAGEDATKEALRGVGKKDGKKMLFKNRQNGKMV